MAKYPVYILVSGKTVKYNFRGENISRREFTGCVNDYVSREYILSFVIPGQLLCFKGILI